MTRLTARINEFFGKYSLPAQRTGTGEAAGLQLRQPLAAGGPDAECPPRMMPLPMNKPSVADQVFTAEPVRPRASLEISEERREEFVLTGL